MKATKSTVRVPQQHHHFLSNWKQPEQLILAEAAQFKQTESDKIKDQ